MCQKLLLYMGEQKAQKEKQKIPEGFGRKVEKTIFIAGVVYQKKYLWKRINPYFLNNTYNLNLWKCSSTYIKHELIAEGLTDSLLENQPIS